MISKVFNSQTMPKTLTSEENIELFNLLKSGDTSAREKLITGNINSVFFCINNRFSTVEYDKDELVSIGIIGLIKAVDTFDHTKGNKFITYLIKCINNEILMFLRKLKKDSRLQSLEQSAYIDKDDCEIQLVNYVSDEIDFTEELIENDYLKECYKLIKKYINELPKREQDIINLYYSNSKKYTQHEIASIVGISQPHVNRILKRTIKDLQVEISKMQNINKDSISIDTINKAKELLYSLEYSQMMSNLTVKEAIIISLQLGYVDGKIFSVNSIANYFKISNREVIEITKIGLLKYRKNLKLFLNEIDTSISLKK